jgi:hypothetical protein
MTKTTHDAVNHPSHYTQYPVEVIELTRHMTFTRGNSVKYIARAGYKGGPEKELEDLKKAKWYLDDDITQLEQKLAEKNALVAESVTSGTINNFVINTSADAVMASKAQSVLDSTLARG